MSVYKKSNGKWYCRFQIDGERHHYLCNGATSKSEAEKIENAFKYKLQQQQNGVIPREDKKIKIMYLFDKFLEYSKVNKKSYKQDISRINLLKEYFKNIKYAEDIKFDEIEKLKQFLLSKNLSKTTVNRYIELISKTFNIAVTNGWVNKNPITKDIKFPIKNYTIRYLTKAEEERLYREAPSYLKDIIFVALNTGLRLGNVLPLNWSQVNMDYSFIEILENKGNKHIKIPINKELYKFFERIPKEKREGSVFINPITGKQPKTIKKVWKSTLKKAHIYNFRFHDLRHTVGTRLAEQGVPVPVIREILAHSDVSTTMRYVHTASNQMKEAMEVLNSYN